MEGEKVTPFVIGKSKMPRCMKNVKNFPVAYDMMATKMHG